MFHATATHLERTHAIEPARQVRPLQPCDFGQLADMGEEFHAERADVLPGTFDRSVFIGTWQALLDQGLGLVLVLEQGGRLIGAIGAVMAPDPCDGAATAQELFWFCRREARGHGMALIAALEDHARAAGIERLAMAHLDGPNAAPLRKLYLRRGYKPVEVHYSKTLNQPQPWQE